MSLTVWDMHVHLDFIRNLSDVVQSADQSGLGMFAVTVTPQDYLTVSQVLEARENVRLGVGLHPWWIADGRCGYEDVELAADLIGKTRFVGEIGIDASPKHVPLDTVNRQTEAFESLCKACALSSDPAEPKILSIHSVKAGTLVLDILEKTGCLKKCFCIFHWFTGSGPELTRAVKTACYFSVNEMMLSTRRGRDYARQIPENRLLLETDLPPGRNIPFSSEEIISSLDRTLAKLYEIRGKDLRTVICGNTERLLNPDLRREIS